jgi:TolB-like protein/class 3 adenylate cyclase/Flp pilus assembly protein TadD
MSTDNGPEVKFEIGHVLFIDIVGYSKLLINQQSEQLETLKKIVRGTEQVRLADAEGKLLRLPTGDGGALVFRTTPEAPVLCAMEIGKELKKHPELHVRMGIHSGPVNEITDLNEQANIAGAGINTAQRVMDCGDAGHILLSKHVADDLEHYPRWQPFLHPLGECEVKHGARIGVVNLHNNEVGNPKAPRKLQAVQQHRARTRWAAIIVALLLLSAIVAAFVMFSNRSGKSTVTITDKSIAVLPFENLSDDKSNAYFADGVQDEILTKLASIADLKVISRTSTAKYASKPEDLKIVSQQLGVATVLEGTVQRAADKVRVNVQLIDARADTHLWAKTFDREIKDVFAVESEVSQEIADALEAKLSPHEASALASAPTQDPEAYDLFLRGESEQREAESSRRPEAFDRAADWYRQAIVRDPNFSLAMARLAYSQMSRHWWIHSLAENELADVKETAEHALRLAPNSAEAHIAFGFVLYWGYRQYDEALGEFQRAVELQPNNARALSSSATIHRRQSQWERSLSEYERAQQLDPRDALYPASVGTTYLQLRMWKEAGRAATHALALGAQESGGMISLLNSRLNGTGDIKEARRIMSTFPSESRITPRTWSSDVVDVIGQRAYLSVIERDFPAALKIWEPSVNDAAAKSGLGIAARPAIHVLAGDTSTTQPESEQVRGVLEATLRERPNDFTTLTQLSWIYLALGHNAEALSAARRATSILPVEKDALLGPGVLTNLAEVEARAGETGAAIKILDRLLSIPAGMEVSIARLKIDPVWDPIRNDPGFQQLLAGKELVGPNK